MKANFILFSFYFTSFLFSQKIENDSIQYLKEIEINPKLKEFSVGHEIINLSTEKNKFQKLNNLLENELGIFFKNKTPGMLTSIQLKGLSPNHAGLYWEGIPLNSSMNGQVDMSLFSNSQFNEIKFRSGGGSSLFGSGALGGSIHLGNTIVYNKKEIQVNQGIGIFDNFPINTFQTDINTTWANENLYFNVALNKLDSKNNYLYQKGNQKTEIENSSIIQENISINTAYKINSNQEIKFNYLKSKSEREIPSSINTSRSYAFQEDDSQRLSLKYKLKNHQVQVAYNDEFFKYFTDKKNANPSNSNAKNYFGRYSFDYSFSPLFKFQINNLTQLTHAEGDSFGKQQLKQNFTNISGFYQISPQLKSSLSLNKSFSSEFKIPFTFDSGLEYKIDSINTIRTNFTTNFRTPTINDLYWNPGGNLNLKPEKGWIHEFGYTFNKKMDKFNLRYNLKSHYGKVNDWILWQPQSLGFWSPINIQKVKIQGYSNQLILDYLSNKFSFGSSSLWNYTESINEENKNQLSFVPFHTFNQNIYLKYKNISTSYTFNYVGKRFTNTDESKGLNAYLIQNINLNYNFKIQNLESSLTFTVNNLFSVAYYGYENYPMPLRNYYINLNIKL